MTKELTEEQKQELQTEISMILNNTGTHTKIQNKLKEFGVEVDCDSQKWFDMEEAIVEKLTENDWD